MITNYLRRFHAEDLDRILKFLVLFARAEYALKKTGFVKSGGHGQAEADWKRYANSIADGLVRITSDEINQAKDYLVEHAPRREIIQGASIRWNNNPRREEETDAGYLLRVVKDVRNNLFHGGKYSEPDGPVKELAYDRELIDAAMMVLEHCLQLDERVRNSFVESA